MVPICLCEGTQGAQKRRTVPIQLLFGVLVVPIWLCEGTQGAQKRRTVPIQLLFGARGKDYGAGAQGLGFGV